MSNSKKHHPVVYRIYDYLQRCKGRENAVSGKTLASIFFPTESRGQRDVREVISIIRCDPTFDNVIGSCNKGYYWATIEEQAIAGKRLYNQGIKCLIAYYAMEKKAEANGQMLLPLTPFIRAAVESLCEVEE